MIKDMYAHQDFRTNRFLFGTKSLHMGCTTVVSTERAESVFSINVDELLVNGWIFRVKTWTVDMEHF